MSEANNGQPYYRDQNNNITIGICTPNEDGTAGGVPLSGGGAVGPAVTVAGSPDTNDECFKLNLTSSPNTVQLTKTPTETSENGLVAGDIIRCYASVDCYIRFDDAATDADTSSMYFSAGTELIKIPAGATHMSAIRASTDGTLYVTKVS